MPVVHVHTGTAGRGLACAPPLPSLREHHLPSACRGFGLPRHLRLLTGHAATFPHNTLGCFGRSNVDPTDAHSTRSQIAQGVSDLCVPRASAWVPGLM